MNLTFDYNTINEPSIIQCNTFKYVDQVRILFFITAGMNFIYWIFLEPLKKKYFYKKGFMLFIEYYEFIMFILILCSAFGTIYPFELWKFTF